MLVCVFLVGTKEIIIIISLFQEDNIFGTNASLTYGPPPDFKFYPKKLTNKIFPKCCNVNFESLFRCIKQYKKSKAR